MSASRAPDRGFGLPFRLTLGVVALALSACDAPAPKPAFPPPEVGVSILAPQSIELKDEFNGRVEAVDAVSLRPRVSGYLQKVAVKEGDHVAAGAVLFVIDQRPYRIALTRAEAQFQQARAAANLAQVQLARVKALQAARASSQEELDNASGTQVQLDAALRGAAAAVDEARLNLSFTEVKSPIAGRVGRALLTVGNLAQADQTVLTTIVSQDPVYVYFDSDEQSYLRYTAQRSDAGTRPIQQRPVRIGLANQPDFPYAGTVDFLDNRFDPATGTIRARARIANPDYRFTPGLYARIQLSGTNAQDVLMVDDKALLTDQDQRYVYVVGADNKALRRDVKVGRVIAGQRIIQAGLQAGDQVVVDGVQKIFYPGAPVKPVPLAGSRSLTH
ncbi:efflux RND transporter periplasmic adaptor subunit [Pigmentiphaga aceris]|uniref:Efflux RND transporter periplasmic adaptor subunit n=1 Tax=Pigmentiphaga aceris TaxID=1940612 RepID=A0A5C0B103_9BURK|nr:efflux RND transporter periplasmic adaptor subunit [Pigmentiphaga aceris]QEI07554.1 efflux RND transporter periplasmic adaptor subunit [Pigmentiphaga aceris]